MPMRLLMTAVCLASLPGGPTAAAPPNVVFILTDDQGAVDAGCYGSTDLVTPNIDALAARGVRFTQFYSAAPVCSPSRAGILTGRYPVRAGVPGNCASQPGEKGALPPEQVTLAETFRGAGYATAHIGKWHLGYTPETLPLAQGFEHSFGHMGGCIDNWSHFFYWSGPNIHDLHRNGREVFHDGHYFPEMMADEAIAFIDRHREQPFFLYFAMNAPHYPYQGEAKWLEHFQDLEYSRRLYAAFLASQDERIGRLLRHLDQAGLRENTIVVLQSDNGHSTEERAHWGGGSAGPYRGAKFSLFEGGIRLPAMISWPVQLPQGEVRDQVAHACDWFPTLAELCGVRLPESGIDGLSLTSVLRSAEAPSPHKTLHWQIGHGPNAQWAVRHGEWKLIGNVQDTTVGNKRDAKAAERPPLFLSNIARDSAERTNLMDSNPDVVQQLQQLHTDETNRP